MLQKQIELNRQVCSMMSVSPTTLQHVLPIMRRRGPGALRRQVFREGADSVCRRSTAPRKKLHMREHVQHHGTVQESAEVMMCVVVISGLRRPCGK